MNGCQLVYSAFKPFRPFRQSSETNVAARPPGRPVGLRMLSSNRIPTLAPRCWAESSTSQSCDCDNPPIFLDPDVPETLSYVNVEKFLAPGIEPFRIPHHKESRGGREMPSLHRHTTNTYWPCSINLVVSTYPVSTLISAGVSRGLAGKIANCCAWPVISPCHQPQFLNVGRTGYVMRGRLRVVVRKEARTQYRPHRKCQNVRPWEFTTVYTKGLP